MKIHGIKPKKVELNKDISLFLIPLIRNFAFKYRYGYQLSTSVLKKQKLMLPTNIHGNPDWIFMENYIRQQNQKELQKIVQYYKGSYSMAVN